ncbi:hypothetical protein ATL10_11112, partial [Bacillus sp. 196mf]
DGKKVFKVKAKVVRKQSNAGDGQNDGGAKNEKENNLVDKSEKLKKKSNEKLKKYGAQSNFVEFDFNDTYVKDIGVEKALNDVMKKFPKSILKECFTDLDGVVFIDREIAASNPLGAYDNKKNKIYIRVNHDAFLNNELENVNVSAVLAHEIGHRIDEDVLNSASRTPKFIKIYNEEMKALSSVTKTTYGEKNPEEFFAEVVQCMFSTNSKQQEGVRAHTPQAVKFIEEKLKELKEK